MSGARSFSGRSALAVAATLVLVMGIFSPRAVDGNLKSQPLSSTCDDSGVA
jgi:hypothetical protein